MNEQMSPLERKEKTEQLLTSLAVPVNPSLPLVESETEARIREAKDVAKRAVVLYFVISVAHGANNKTTVSWLKDEGLWDAVSPMEKDFLESGKPTERVVIESSWRAESLWVLLWALGKIEELALPRELCDTEVVHNLMDWIEQDPSAIFIDRAKLRSPHEILNETDLIYRIHWAVRDAQLNDEEVPGGFDSGVVYERHYAFNWLTCYSEDWDDVTTDT